MDFRLSEQDKLIRDSAREFGKRWAPRMQEVRERTLKEARFPEELWSDFASQGFLGALLPERYGGSDMGLWGTALAFEAMAAEGVSSALFMLTLMDALCILRSGPDDLRERYLPRIARGELKLAFAITEPEAGSNAFRMQTVARCQGDQIVLNGQKTFITGVDVADRILVIARSMPDAERREKGLPKVAGFNLVLVDPSSEGLSMTEVPTEGIEGLKQWTLHFDDVKIARSELIGQEHQGAVPMFDVLNAERTLATAMSIGHADQLLKRSVDYANERVVFGDKPIGAYQAIQHPLAEIKSELEAARLLFHKAAWLFDNGASAAEIGPIASMAKMLAGELSIRAADRAIQTHGGNGFSRDYGLIQAWVNTRLVRTAPVSKEMILNLVAEHVLGLPRSY